jgi:hypothetical protein
MVHTLPDYTTKYKLATIFANIDEAELSVRLGSNCIFDRRGNVVFSDSFEQSAIFWTQTISGAGTSIAQDTTTARTGGKSVKFTLGAVIGAETLISKYLQSLLEKRIGIEAHFSTESTAGTIEIRLDYTTGTRVYMSGIKYSVADEKIYYYASSGDFLTLATGIKIQHYKYTFIPIKYVIDLVTGKYVRLLFNNDVYDLSTYSLSSGAYVSAEYSNPWILCHNPSASQKIFYLDDVIITQNEP